MWSSRLTSQDCGTYEKCGCQDEQKKSVVTAATNFATKDWRKCTAPIKEVDGDGGASMPTVDHNTKSDGPARSIILRERSRKEVQSSSIIEAIQKIKACERLLFPDCHSESEVVASWSVSLKSSY